MSDVQEKVAEESQKEDTGWEVVPAEEADETDDEEVVEVKERAAKPSASRTQAQFQQAMAWLRNMPSVTSKSIHWNMSLFGPRGSGKTTLAASIAGCLPDDKPEVFYVDVEGSLVSILNRRNPCYQYRDLIKPYTPRNFDELLKVTGHLLDAVNDLPFGAYVIDTVGEFAEDTVTEVLQKNLASSAGARSNRYLSSEHEYRERNERLRQLFKQLRNAPIHVILISHEADPDKDNGLGPRPQLSPKVRQMAENNCDAQFRTLGALEGQKFVGTCEISASEDVNTSIKTRIMGLPAIMRQPTMTQILRVKKPTRSETEDGEN